MSGFEYQKAKSELMKSKNSNRTAFLNEEKDRKKKQRDKNKGKVFERKNLMAGSKRGRNLQELISPTVRKKKCNT